mgnify:CR=1 FL=1
MANIIDTNLRNNEITLITFKYAFPLRYLQPIHQLKEKYDYRLANGSKERALLEIHLQEHIPALPSLLRPQTAQARKEIMPLLQLATALNLFTRTQNPHSGKMERVLETLDEYGIPAEHIYSDDLVNLFETPKQTTIVETSKLQNLLKNSNELEVEILQSAVESALNHETYKLASNRQALIEKIKAQIFAIKENRDNNIYDEIYKEFQSSTRTAIERVNTIFKEI